VGVVQETRIVYSAKSTRWFLLSLLIVTAGTLVVGLAGSSETLTFVGFGALAFGGLFAYAVRGRLGADQTALYRDGDWLQGAALPRPFLAADTRYEVASDYEGGWVVVLTDSQGKARLAPGGWRLADGGRVTRATVATALTDMGLAPAPR
jgi:hypothetical protein